MMLNAPSVTILKKTLFPCLMGTYGLTVPLSNKNEIRKRKKVASFSLPFYTPSEAKPTKNPQNSLDKPTYSRTIFKYLV